MLPHAYHCHMQHTVVLQSAGNRGYVLQLCNAIRLQADTMPPTEFLRTYLSSHEQWRNFVGVLREATLQQQTPGLGFEVSKLINADFELKAASSGILGASSCISSCHQLRRPSTRTCAQRQPFVVSHVSVLPRLCQVPVVPRYYSNGPENLGNQQPPEDGGIDHG